MFGYWVQGPTSFDLNSSAERTTNKSKVRLGRLTVANNRFPLGGRDRDLQEGRSVWYRQMPRKYRKYLVRPTGQGQLPSCSVSKAEKALVK